jgi:hypothetical protein
MFYTEEGPVEDFIQELQRLGWKYVALYEMKPIQRRTMKNLWFWNLTERIQKSH